MRFWGYMFLLICCIAVVIFCPNFQGIAYSIIASLILFIVDYVTRNFKRFKLLIICHTKYRNEFIRLSISYLFKIKINNQYLLVRGNRIKNQYQPVGGVIKSFQEATTFFTSIGVLNDDCIPFDKKSKDDLRIRVKGKNLIKFIDWYDKGKEREVSAFREFYEELIESGIVSRENFPYITYRYLNRHEESIEFVNEYQVYGLLIAEIYELIPTINQEKELKSLIKNKNDNYIWASEELIRQMGVQKGKETNLRIAKTATWLIDN